LRSAPPLGLCANCSPSRGDVDDARAGVTRGALARGAERSGEVELSA
jgi:sulfur relay (sulfurtransferase) complex TusBCD TusD component (DsrE family)